MTITREQVADLREGDVVEVRDDRWPEGTSLRGPVWTDGALAGSPCVGWFYLRKDANEHHILTVVSRAPRPLYVNHPRTEPVPCDLVRNADENPGDETRTWFLDYAGHWRMTRAHKSELSGCNLPARLRLLVDGETGLPPAVQS